MVYQGIIHNGVVVLQNGADLPEGTVVKVERLTPAPPDDKRQVDQQLDPVFRIGELAEDAGTADLSINIDHYLYGHPKASDER